MGRCQNVVLRHSLFLKACRYKNDTGASHLNAVGRRDCGPRRRIESKFEVSRRSEDPSTNIANWPTSQAWRGLHRYNQATAPWSTSEPMEARWIFRPLVPSCSTQHWFAPSSAEQGFRRSGRSTPYLRGLSTRIETSASKVRCSIPRCTRSTDTAPDRMLLC